MSTLTDEELWARFPILEGRVLSPMERSLYQTLAKDQDAGLTANIRRNTASVICLCGHSEGHHLESESRGPGLEVPAMGLMLPVDQGGNGATHGCFVHNTPEDRESVFGRHWPPTCRCTGFTPVLEATGWGNWFRNHSPRDRAPANRDDQYRRYIKPPLGISLARIIEENYRRELLASKVTDGSKIRAKDRPRDLSKTLVWLIDCPTCGASSKEYGLQAYFANPDLDPAVGCDSCTLKYQYDPLTDADFETRVYKEDRA